MTEKNEDVPDGVGYYEIVETEDDIDSATGDIKLITFYLNKTKIKALILKSCEDCQLILYKEVGCSICKVKDPVGKYHVFNTPFGRWFGCCEGDCKEIMENMFGSLGKKTYVGKGCNTHNFCACENDKEI